MKELTKLPVLPPRKCDAHKGDFGRVLIVGGSLGMSGAAAMAGRAALRCGAGLVRVAVPRGILPIVASIEPSFTTAALREDSSGRISSQSIGAVLKAAAENDVVAFGPGAGISAGLGTILSRLIAKEELRLVIDADGLNNLAMIKNWPKKRLASVVLTPHPGEMKRLWKALISTDIPADRRSQAAELAKRTNCTIVLKGAGTVVADTEMIYVNKTGNPGMATAGSGDVLTGAIAALIGQGLKNFDAAALGVHTHGLAGDIAAERLGQAGMIATDIIDSLPAALKRMSGPFS